MEVIIEIIIKEFLIDFLGIRDIIFLESLRKILRKKVFQPIKMR